MIYESVNPYTEEKLASFPLLAADDAQQAVAKAIHAQKAWYNLPLKTRAEVFMALAQLLQQNHEQLAKMAVLEMGKNIAEAKLEVLKCARGCEYYANHAEALLQTQWSLAETGKKVGIHYQPLGVVLGIFPWNFPYWQIIRSLVPTLIAGNAMLVKPAPNVPQCALLLFGLLQQLSIPDGVAQLLFVNEAQVESLIKNSAVQAVTLTGSEKAGGTVAALAAKEIKKSVLELGGNDAFIVMDDADIDLATTQAITARFQNNGQSCIAAKRFMLHSHIADDFIKQFIQKLSLLKMGNPMLPETNIGPLARVDLRDKLYHQVNQLVKQGASIIYQANDVPAQGYFYPPTLLKLHNQVVFDEELFGPVGLVYAFDEEEQAIEIANNSQFGLGASVWSNDLKRATSVAEKLVCGQVFINEMVKSQPAHPFGGVKKSGYGRELGPQGLYEFCNLKTIWI